MVRLADLPEHESKHLQALPCPTYADTPLRAGPPLHRRRVAIVSTAGLHVRGDQAFTMNSDDYRVIPGDVRAEDLVMSHVSTNFDRTGFQRDLNVTFPLDRLREMAESGVIGEVASYHYSFMGGTDPTFMEKGARKVAAFLKSDRVDGVLLVPV